MLENTLKSREIRKTRAFRLKYLLVPLSFVMLASTCEYNQMSLIAYNPIIMYCCLQAVAEKGNVVSIYE